MATATVKKVSNKLSPANQELLNSKRLQQLEHKVEFLCFHYEQEQMQRQIEYSSRLTRQKKKDIFTWGIVAGLWIAVAILEFKKRQLRYS